MKRNLLLLLLAASLSLTSLADTSCIAVARGHHLFAGRVNLNQQWTTRATIYVVQSGTIEPTWTLWWMTGPNPPYAPPLAPGQGCVLASITNLNVCFTNNPTPILPLSLAAGYNLVSCQSNGPATFEDIVGRSPDPGTRLYRYIDLPDNDPTVLNETNFTIYTFADGTWVPETPTVNAAEAVWILQPPTFSNIQVSDGLFSFDVLTPEAATVTVEYTENLTSGSWSELTNFAGNGGVMNVVDPAGVDAVTQRFYRVNLHK